MHGNSNTHLQHQRLITAPVRGVASTSRGSQQTGDLQLHPQQIHAVSGSGTGGYILATGGPHIQHQVTNQQHYDPEAALVETIVTHLGNLNEDEVVIYLNNLKNFVFRKL